LKNGSTALTKVPTATKEKRQAGPEVQLLQAEDDGGANRQDQAHYSDGRG
jgi:hypothetical protein